ncbi:MAG: uracil-DNA glycosylase [Bacteroidales bacterium]|nr:uracil-DNA glycosylase [Bacteroidales bacterium]MBQ3983010.1 uracil-DNA glycosylase [Bacteroidales bacterium]MBR3985816.1 uracil-DNA glycosylase [Bacteroidales bacterium]
MSPRIEASWLEVLRPQFEAPYFAQLKEFLIAERQQYVCYPKGSDIFAAFDRTPFDKVKVVILGQDPYHEPEQAHGLCFSVRQGVAVPPSLVNIIKEINSDLGTQIPLTCGDLSHWADQGVLLLNATLTVRAHQAGSHQHHGWEQFTDAAIQALNQYRQGIVFLLWGSFAISKAQFIDRTKHYVLTAPHPSPLSAYRGFFGCRHFSQCNAILMKEGKEPIRWEEIG